MDLRALKIFQSVAHHLSFSKAAAELNYAQSNVTLKIQQLENSLQTTLFHRHNRGVILTEKGKELLIYANKISQLIEETYEVMQDSQKPRSPLRIGSMETTAAIRLPPLLTKYHTTYPNVDLTLCTGTTEQNISDVLHHQLDGAFVSDPENHPDLEKVISFEEELVLVTNLQEPPFKKLSEIKNQTILVFRSGCSYRANLESWFRTEHIIPNKIMEFGTLDAIIGCVTAGLGISLLPYSVIAKHVNEKQLNYYPIPRTYGIVKTFFVYRTDKYINSSLKSFLNLL